MDCWSFGVLMYELLTMSTPFKTNQDETVRRRMRHDVFVCVRAWGGNAAHMIDARRDAMRLCPDVLRFRIHFVFGA